MRTLVLLLCAAVSSALVTNSALSRAASGLSRSEVSRVTTMEYIPDGLSKAQWAKIKQKEKDKTKNMKFDGTSGMKFRSRSMADFLEGREKGIYKYNMVRPSACPPVPPSSRSSRVPAPACLPPPRAAASGG